MFKRIFQSFLRGSKVNLRMPERPNLPQSSQTRPEGLRLNPEHFPWSTERLQTSLGRAGIDVTKITVEK